MIKKCCLLFFAVWAVISPECQPAPTEGTASTSRIQSLMAALPLAFEPNMAQAASPVKFLAHGVTQSIILSESGAVVLIANPKTI